MTKLYDLDVYRNRNFMIRIADVTLGTRGFSRVQREFSVLAMSGVASHAGGKTSSPKNACVGGYERRSREKNFSRGSL